MQRNPAIARAVEEHRDAIKAFLAEMVNQTSYTHNPADVERVGAMVEREMPSCFELETFPNDRFAAARRFTHAPGGRPILLGGHIDTLCPPDGPVTSLIDRGDKLLGPGVNDMKGGVCVMVWALKILDRLGMLADLPVVCVVNGDEEVGSPTSSPYFRETAKQAARALIFECSGPEGTVVTTRKGCLRYRLAITGAPSHFGNLKGRKSSAVLQMAHKTVAFEALNAPDGALAVNVGRVEGGLAANAVAEHATMDVDIRYWTLDAEAVAREKLEEINAACQVPGCDSRMERLSYRPPMRPTDESMAMFDLIVRLGEALGEPIVEEKRGGLSDGNWVAHEGCPVIDGLGPRGDGDFTPDEFIYTESLFQRVELVATLLPELARRG